MSNITITENIRIQVDTKYLEEHSNPNSQRWVFAYRVHIQNQSTHTVQLLRRHWIITDGFGETEHVRGDGVIGKQPTLRPNEEHQYVSGCPLPTSMGSMKGTYQMQDENGRIFDVKISEFLLVTPDSFQ
tara:strand:+ start:370 stop:756 length:387 start_codon:yes stop_codon:yes gene_type:complete